METQQRTVDYPLGQASGAGAVQRPDWAWQNRDERTGHLTGVKDDGTPHKGLAREPDGRNKPGA